MISARVISWRSLRNSRVPWLNCNRPETIGSLAGPRLYFEIRRGGDAVDPAEWLRGVAGR